MNSLYQTAHTGPVTAARYADVLIVLIATIPALALGIPSAGYLIGGGAWVVSRLLQANRHRWVSRLDHAEPTRRAAINTFEAFGRIWLLAGAIIVAGAAGHRQDGLTAAVVIFGAYSIAFVIRLMSGPPQEIR